MKKLFTKSVSVFLAMLLVMTSSCFTAFALDTDEDIAKAAEYDAFDYMEDISLSYRVSNYEVQAQDGNFYSTKMNSGHLIIHKVPLPKVPVGKQIDQFIFRTGAAKNNIVMLRLDYADWDFSTLPKKYGADSEQLKPITTSGYLNYSIVEGTQYRISTPQPSYHMVYSDITTYAKECIAKGQEYFYMAVGCYASTTGVAQGCMRDSTYLGIGLDPKVLYTFKDAAELEFVSSSVENAAEDVAADSEVSFEFSNELTSAEVTINGEAGECSIDGSSVVVESLFAECADYDVKVSVKDIYGQSSEASVRFSTGLKSGAVLPENPSIGTYNVKCILSDDNAELEELSFKLLTEYDDINSAIEIREIGGDKVDVEFVLDEETLRYNITAPVALDEGCAYEAVIKAGVEDKYGDAAQEDVVITKFLAGETNKDEFADASDCDFSVELDKENSTLDVWFQNAAYSNREIELSVLLGDEVIISETVVTGARGIATLEDAELSESGEYTIRVCPANSPECFGMAYDFYTPEDILAFWDVIAKSGKADDVLNNMETLFELFGLYNDYMVEISDFAVLAEKIVSLRGKGLGDMTADSENALKVLVKEASLFTAFEQCKDPETIRTYVEENFEALQSANSGVCSRWTERLTTQYAEKIVNELTQADKTINAYTDITSAMDVPLKKYSVENLQAQEYEALGDVVDIPDSYKVSGGKIANDSGNMESVIISGGSMIIHKIKLPTLPAGKTIEKFIFRTGASDQTLTVLKLTHAMPSLSELPTDVPESFAPIMASETYKQYSAVDGKIIKISNNYYPLHYIDLTSYAKECLADGYEYMYIGIGCYSSTCKVAQGCMTDTDYTKAGLDPKYIASFGEPDPNGFVSSTIKNNAADVPADSKVTFKFINAIGSVVATLNGENVDVSIKGREVTLANPLKECTDYELSVSATDIFGQKVTKAIRFSTGFNSGMNGAQTPVIGVYDSTYVVDAASNELLELSFNLLTKFEDINQAIEIREIGGDKIESEFIFYDVYNKYDVAYPVALAAGEAYEAVIKKDVSDIYGNTASEDVVIAKFYAGETPAGNVSSDNDYVLDVTFDAAEATLGVYFKNSAYANVETEIFIEKDGEEVYGDIGKAGKGGVLIFEDIVLSSNGKHTLKLVPKNAPEIFVKDIAFYDESEIERFWNMVTVNGSASDIASNWEAIEFVFDLSNNYSKSVKNVNELASKIKEQRSGFGEMDEAGREALKNLVTKLSYFTAIQQSETAEETIALVASEFDTLLTANKAICDEWELALESEFKAELKASLEEIDLGADSYEDVTDIMDKALDAYRVKNILKTVAAAYHKSEIKDIVTNEKNAILLGIDKFMDDYNKLKSTSSVDKAMMKEFESAEEFAKAFEKAVKAAQNAEDDKDNGSGGGGSGAPSGKGGTSGFQVVSTAPVETAPFNPFGDINDIAWAKDHIIKLYNKGVISGKSSDAFAPNDKITREEFTKLIISMTGIADDGSTVDFADVPADSWYAPYVKAAVSGGVAKGIGDGCFGVGMNATRQDIAVMIVNALVKKGVVMTEEVSAFADNNDISDYAKAAVAFLNAKGVVTGDTNGYFNPKANATRAEVAVMLSRVSDIFSKEVK